MVNPANQTEEEMLTELLLWLKKLNPVIGELWANMFLADLVREMNRQAPPGQWFGRKPDGNYGFMRLKDERKEK